MNGADPEQPEQADFVDQRWLSGRESHGNHELEETDDQAACGEKERVSIEEKRCRRFVNRLLPAEAAPPNEVQRQRKEVRQATDPA